MRMSATMVPSGRSGRVMRTDFQMQVENPNSSVSCLGDNMCLFVQNLQVEKFDRLKNLRKSKKRTTEKSHAICSGFLSGFSPESVS